MKILVVVDMQNDFIDGSLGTPEAREIVPNVIKKVKEYHEAHQDIKCTQDTHYENYLTTREGEALPVEHCIINTDGWKIIDDIASCASMIYQKNSFGALSMMLDFKFSKEILDQYVESFEVCGLCTDICVLSNVILIRTLFPEKKIVVDAKCCAGSTSQAHKETLKLMKESLQIEVINWDEE